MLIKHVKPLMPHTLAIITPYKEQMIRTREMIHDNLSSLIEVNTVDAFQGQEKDIIIFSCVRSHDFYGESKGIGFLRDTRRLNVALTRAKYALYTVGQSDVLKRHAVWNRYLRDMNLNHKIKALLDMDSAIETLNCVPVHTKLRVDHLSICQSDIKQSAPDDQVLGKRMMLEPIRNQSVVEQRMNVEDISHTQRKDVNNSKKMDLEFEYKLPNQRETLQKKPSRPEAQIIKSKEGPIVNLKKKSEDKVELDRSGPKTLKDLIKSSAVNKKSGTKKSLKTFDLVAELGNCNFEKELHDS